jgi:hypothetical protein
MTLCFLWVHIFYFKSRTLSPFLHVLFPSLPCLPIAQYIRTIKGASNLADAWIKGGDIKGVDAPESYPAGVRIPYELPRVGNQRLEYPFEHEDCLTDLVIAKPDGGVDVQCRPRFTPHRISHPADNHIRNTLVGEGLGQPEQNFF